MGTSLVPKTTIMKNVFLVLALASLVLFGCEKEENEPTVNTGGGGGGGSYGYVSGPQGANLSVTYPDGTTESLSGSSVIGWDGGQLLNGNFWKQLRISADGNTFFLRYNMVQGTDWEAEVAQEWGLYNFPFLLQYSADMTDTAVEWYCPSCDDFEENASGNVELELDVNTPGGMYDVVGSIDATFTINGLQTTVEGNFWAQELQ